MAPVRCMFVECSSACPLLNHFAVCNEIVTVRVIKAVDKEPAGNAKVTKSTQIAQKT